jgi:sugar-specific transcriptional regulator TrmB
MNQQQLLKQCGLTDKQAKTYIALLKLGSSTIAPVSRLSGVKRTSIYNFIDDLVELGIVGKVKKGLRWYYHAESPNKLLAIQKARYSALEEALPALNRLYTKRGVPPLVSYFEGPNEVRQIVAEELECSKEALYIWPASDSVPALGGVRYLTEMDRKRIRCGVAVRSIHFRDKQVNLATGSSGKRYLREVRFAPKGVDLEMGVGIYDTGRVGFFSSGGESFGTLIQSGELARLMRVLFEYFWVRCDAE